MPPAEAVAVLGLKALMRDLKKMSDPRAGELIKAMAQAGRQAAQPVADAVRSAYPSRTGRLAGSVRVTGSRSGAAIRVGRKTVPYAGPVDFGGWPRPGGGTGARWHGGAFRTSEGDIVEGGRPWIPTGRYLYPVFEAHRAEVVTSYVSAVNAVVEGFHWTNTGSQPHD